MELLWRRQLADRYNLHGKAERKSIVALLLIDFINDLEFPKGRKLLRQALGAARNTAKLKRAARAAGIPVIYVNDNLAAGAPISSCTCAIA